MANDLNKRSLSILGEYVKMQPFLTDNLELYIAFVIAMCFQQ